MPFSFAITYLAVWLRSGAVWTVEYCLFVQVFHPDYEGSVFRWGGVMFLEFSKRDVVGVGSIVTITT